MNAANTAPAPAPRPPRSRLRRGLNWAAVFVGGVLVLACALLFWLLATTGGRDTLLGQIVSRLPPGALRWESAEGVVSGPLELRGVVWDHDGVVFRAERLLLDPDLLPVLGRRLQLDRLEVEDAELVLPPEAEPAPFTLPTWPDLLPRLPMPLAIDTTVLAIDGLAVRRGDDELVDIRRLDARAVRLRDDGFELEEARLASDRGDAVLRGHYRPARRFASDLQVDLRLPAGDGTTAPELHLRLHGDLDSALQLDIGGALPEPVVLQAVVRDGDSDAPRWTLRADVEGLDPALLDPTGEPSEATRWRGHLTVDGTGAALDLHGDVDLGGFVAGIAPSRLVLAETAVTAAPLALELAQGPLEIAGTLAFADAGVVDLRATTPGLHLQPGDPAQPAVDLAGSANVQGTLDAWTLQAELVAARAGLRAEVVAAGEGDREHLRLDTLRATTPDGRLDGSGGYRWAPAPEIALEAGLAGFDPGFFAPDFPGHVDGRAQLRMQQDAGGDWAATLRLDDLGGTLRERPLAGHVHVDWRGDRGEGEADLRLGDSQLRARGVFGARWDLAISASPLQLVDARGDLAGRLEGDLRLHGASAALAIDADLQAQDLAFGDHRATALRLAGTLPARGGDGQLRLDGEGLQLAGTAVERLHVEGRGSRAELQLAAEAEAAAGRLALAGLLVDAADGWRGRLDRLQLVPQRGPSLRLEAPAGFRFAGDQVQLERTCLLASDPGGRLCARAEGRVIDVDGDGLPLALVQPWLPDDTGVALQAVGTLDLEGRLQQTAAGWGGRLTLTSASAGLRLAEDLEREVFGWRDLVLTAELSPDGGGRLQAGLRAGLADDGSLGADLSAGLADDAALTGEFNLDVRDLTWLELFSEDVAVPVGTLSGQLRLAGTRATPLLSGDARLAGFAAELPALGVKLHDGDIRLTGAPDGSVVLDGRVSSGEGVLHVGGSLDVDDDTVPLVLTLRGENVTLASTAELYAVAAPDLALRWLPDRLEVRGSLTVPEARIDLEALDGSVGTSADVIVVDPVDPAGERSRPLDLQFQVRLGDDVKLLGFGLDGRIAGNLALSERPGRRATASGTLTVSGDYRAYGQSLRITQARLGFADSPYDDPTLDIRAEREFDSVTVGVQVRGTARRPQTTITSTPAMSTSEALSWLVFGRPLRTTTSGESEQLGAAALALGAGGNLVAQQLGAKLGLDEAGVADSRNLGGATLTVGKYVSPRLFLSYGVSLIGTGQVVTLKYLLTRDFDISIESGAENAASLNWRRER
ncbi:translocation/assembly module TamB domain-containing protein [Arenimonas composti]|uniref:Translocation and assembly module TamB C-terminal domain-containing protein n=1 Tax=Arenimonas composti TR7-09 = DSM 18010 TaxID=1121013 RepID=A0A091BDE9_9GAMM|nr:translocation/assembly module TamB domain-containing protein [Arenimonas composti]KFN49532.1 hypothetical protein P873_10285 [Arenimonas composti TR7-09 = DSM 18010]